MTRPARHGSAVRPFVRKPKLAETPDARAYRIRLIRNLTFEIVPLTTTTEAIAALPESAEVSVVYSPIKGWKSPGLPDGVGVGIVPQLWFCSRWG